MKSANIRIVGVLLSMISLVAGHAAAQSSLDTMKSGRIPARKGFWKRIYAEFDSSTTVIFEKRSLKIYALCGNERVDIVLDSLKRNRIDPNTLRVKPGRKEFVRWAVHRAQRYSFIPDSLKKYGLHPDLRWLPVLESGYLDTMVSEQNAMGIWQFIPETAKHFGLRVEDIRDPFKSTGAFIRYFTLLQKEFDDYALALTAYHHGEGGIRRKLKASGGKSLEDILPLLGFQSRNYYAKFLAIVEIAHEYGKRINDADEVENMPPEE